MFLWTVWITRRSGRSCGPRSDGPWHRVGGRDRIDGVSQGFGPSIPSVSVAEVPERAEATLLDVREDDEWQQGHAPGAVHVPMGDVPSRLAEISVDGELYVVCRQGGRSARVVEYLQHAGIDAVNVDGGMVAWQQAGLPVVDDAGRPATVY